MLSTPTAKPRRFAAIAAPRGHLSYTRFDGEYRCVCGHRTGSHDQLVSHWLLAAARQWTPEGIAAHRARGHRLVTHGDWCVTYGSGGGIDGCRLDASRWSSITTADTLTRTFPTVEDAECWALNEGLLCWEVV